MRVSSFLSASRSETICSSAATLSLSDLDARIAAILSVIAAAEFRAALAASCKPRLVSCPVTSSIV
jgi:hypothetical protein